jgi:very-short-patch-repair endonuclease
MKMLDIKVLRFLNNEIDKNMEGVLERIKEEIDG